MVNPNLQRGINFADFKDGAVICLTYAPTKGKHLLRNFFFSLIMMKRTQII
jgi:hypothetical protein